MNTKVKTFFIILIMTAIHTYLSRNYVFTEIDIKAGYWSYLFYSILTFIGAFLVLTKIQFYIFNKLPAKLRHTLLEHSKIAKVGSIFSLTMIINLLLNLQFVLTDYGSWKLNISIAEKNMYFQKKNIKYTSVVTQEKKEYLNKAVSISKNIIKDPKVERYTLKLRDNYLKSSSRVPASK